MEVPPPSPAMGIEDKQQMKDDYTINILSTSLGEGTFFIGGGGGGGWWAGAF